MSKIEVRASTVPRSSLLQRYAGGDHHADAYAVDVGRQVSLEEFVSAFYGTWLFGLERIAAGTRLYFGSAVAS